VSFVIKKTYKKAQIVTVHSIAVIGCKMGASKRAERAVSRNRNDGRLHPNVIPAKAEIQTSWSELFKDNIIK
jgi:hypothetical protein